MAFVQKLASLCAVELVLRPFLLFGLRRPTRLIDPGIAIQGLTPSPGADNNAGVWAGSRDFKTISPTAEGRLAAFGASSPFQPQPLSSTTSFAQYWTGLKEPAEAQASSSNVINLKVFVPASVRHLVVAAEPL